MLRVLRVMLVQWSRCAQAFGICVVADCMTGLLNFDLGKRGNLILLGLLWICAIYFTFYAMVFSTSHFLHTCVNHCVFFHEDAHEQDVIIIYSLAFGGRGVFMIRRKRKRKQWTRQNNNSDAVMWVCKMILSTFLCWLMIIVAVLAWTILDNASNYEFDATIGFPGEGRGAHGSGDYTKLRLLTG